jgi:hypothetical protein
MKKNNFALVLVILVATISQIPNGKAQTPAKNENSLQGGSSVGGGGTWVVDKNGKVVDVADGHVDPSTGQSMEVGESFWPNYNNQRELKAELRKIEELLMTQGGYVVKERRTSPFYEKELDSLSLVQFRFVKQIPNWCLYRTPEVPSYGDEMAPEVAACTHGSYTYLLKHRFVGPDAAPVELQAWLIFHERLKGKMFTGLNNIDAEMGKIYRGLKVARKQLERESAGKFYSLSKGEMTALREMSKAVRDYNVLGFPSIKDLALKCAKKIRNQTLREIESCRNLDPLNYLVPEKFLSRRPGGGIQIDGTFQDHLDGFNQALSMINYDDSDIDAFLKGNLKSYHESFLLPEFEKNTGIPEKAESNGSFVGILIQLSGRDVKFKEASVISSNRYLICHDCRFEKNATAINPFFPFTVSGKDVWNGYKKNENSQHGNRGTLILGEGAKVEDSDIEAFTWILGNGAQLVNSSFFSDVPYAKSEFRVGSHRKILQSRINLEAALTQKISSQFRVEYNDSLTVRLGLKRYFGSSLLLDKETVKALEKRDQVVNRWIEDILL